MRVTFVSNATTCLLGHTEPFAMPGIYLNVWDEKERDASEILKPTHGGWPHITLAHTGDFVSTEHLTMIQSLLLPKTVGQYVEVTEAYCDSFKKDDGTQRHDILLRVKENEVLEEARRLIRTLFPDIHRCFAMRDFHVTHAIYGADVKEAFIDEKVARLNDPGNGLLPRTLLIKGISM